MPRINLLPRPPVESISSQLTATPEEKQEAKGRERNAVAALACSEPANRRGQDRYACRLGAEVYQQGSSVRATTATSAIWAPVDATWKCRWPSRQELVWKS